MLLSALVKNISHEMLGEDVEIRAIEYNSRRIQPGDLFCCIVGTFSDGHNYAQNAVEAGAAALVVERRLPLDVPQILVENSRIAMAEIAAEYYGHPAEQLTIVGITGTNGKTSTTYMIKSIAEQMGLKVGLIGTIRNLIGDKHFDTERTTPESVELQGLLRCMCDEKVDLVVMEVSSHSLDQGRVHGVTFDVAEFTNLTQDHLDYHKTFENYINAKKMLFRQSKKAVINADDPKSSFMVEGIDIPTLRFGVRERADISATDIDITPEGVQFNMHSSLGTTHMKAPIPGLFSVFNVLGAAGVAMTLGYTEEAITRGIENMLRVSGRLEPLPTGGRPYSVLLDYAHTPDAIENILKSVRGFAKGRIITLFGCGGNRDKAKRPIMGEIAGMLSDYLIVTSDNPRDEEPMDIIRAIEEGVKKSGCEYTVIENRRDAIRFALMHAQENDIIILAGKGHENYQEICGVKHHFDEKEVVAELLAELPRCGG